nr:hypothetical protein [Tanacetum cinerariifolium]
MVEIVKGFLSPRGRGRGVKEKEKQDKKSLVFYADVNTLDATSWKFTKHEDDLNRRLKEASLTSVNTDLAKISSMVSPTTANESNESTKGPILTKNTSRPVSFATMFRSAQSRKTVNFRTLVALLVKVQDIPISAFTEDGLSAIATKLGTPMMLDSYASAMCMDSWVRSSYAKALVELGADVELKDTLVVVSSPDGSSPRHLVIQIRPPLATRINGLERQMLDGKLVLVDDDGKPLKPHFDPVNADSDSEVDMVFSETTSFMASMSSKVNKSSKSGSGTGNKSLYKTWKETCKEPYDDDDFDDCCLIDAQIKFANTFDISLRGQLR